MANDEKDEDLATRIEVAIDRKDDCIARFDDDVQLCGKVEMDSESLANVCQMAVEAILSEPPGDVLGWEGVTFLVITGDGGLEVTGGWKCPKCKFVLGGDIVEPPADCPVCKGEG